MKNPELPDKATATTEREFPSGVSFGTPKIKKSRIYDCQEIDRRDVEASLARYAETDEGKRDIERSKLEAAALEKSLQNPPKFKSANPFKRISFKIDGATFAKFYGHQPTPEPLENLYDTKTLKRLVDQQNTTGTSKRFFVWRHWRWLLLAFLVGGSGAIGDYLAMALKKPASTTALQAATEQVIIHNNVASKGATNDKSPLPQAVVNQPVTPRQPATADTAENPVSSRVAPPVTRTVTQSKSKRNNAKAPPKTAATSKVNDAGAATPYAKTQFIPVD